MSGTELLIILVVAMLLLGEKELPKAAKTLGKTMRDLRKAGDELRETFEREIMDEPPTPKGPPPGAMSANNGRAPNANASGPALPAPAGEPAENSPRPQLMLAASSETTQATDARTSEGKASEEHA